MIRIFSISLLLLGAGCGPKLIRSDAGWALEGRQYAVTPLPDGRIMGDGWALRNYEKVDKARLRQVDASEVDMSYGRKEDDGYLEVRILDEVDARKTLRTLAERLVNAFRHQQRLIRVGRVATTYEVDSPVTELARATFGGDDLEAHEAVIEQRHAGEPAPFRSIYLALVRPRGSKELLTVLYANSPAAFLSGIDDARALVRRLKFGDRRFATEPKPFEYGAPRALDAAPGDTTRL